MHSTNIYIWRKVDCSVLYLSGSLNWDASDRVLDVFGKNSARRCAWAWFHNVWTCSAKVLEYWMISSLKTKLNYTLKFRRNWNVSLVLTWSERVPMEIHCSSERRRAQTLLINILPGKLPGITEGPETHSLHDVQGFAQFSLQNCSEYALGLAHVLVKTR